jgi:hypothetical protein
MIPAQTVVMIFGASDPCGLKVMNKRLLFYWMSIYGYFANASTYEKILLKCSKHKYEELE